MEELLSNDEATKILLLAISSATRRRMWSPDVGERALDAIRALAGPAMYTAAMMELRGDDREFHRVLTMLQTGVNTG